MFAYNPTVNDMSGQIMAQGTVGAAQTNQQMMQGLGENIGNALANIGGVIGGAMEKKAIGDSAYEALGAIGEMYPGMKSAFGALGKLDDRTRRLASLSILDNLGAISQLGIAGMNQQARAAQPYMNAAAKTAATVSGGGGTVQIQDDPMSYAPTSSPGTGALQAASAWYNQSASVQPTSMSRGAMKPFWKGGK